MLSKRPVLSDPTGDGPARLLVAVPDAAQRHILAWTLEAAGAKVAEAATAVEALSACDAGEFDMVLMDASLAGADGLLAAAEARGVQTGEIGASPRSSATLSRSFDWPQLEAFVAERLRARITPPGRAGTE